MDVIFERMEQRLTNIERSNRFYSEQPELFKKFQILDESEFLTNFQWNLLFCFLFCFQPNKLRNLFFSFLWNLLLFNLRNLPLLFFLKLLRLFRNHLHRTWFALPKNIVLVFITNIVLLSELVYARIFHFAFRVRFLNVCPAINPLFNFWIFIIFACVGQWEFSDHG